MHCKNCGEAMNEEQAICIKCGTKKGKGEKFCEHCGKEVASEADICMSCGCKVKRSKKEDSSSESFEVSSFINLLPIICGLGSLFCACFISTFIGLGIGVVGVIAAIYLLIKKRGTKILHVLGLFCSVGSIIICIVSIIVSLIIAIIGTIASFIIPAFFDSMANAFFGEISNYIEEFIYEMIRI